MARVYADVNQNMPRAYWDYDSVNISGLPAFCCHPLPTKLTRIRLGRSGELRGRQKDRYVDSGPDRYPATISS